LLAVPFEDILKEVISIFLLLFLPSFVEEPQPIKANAAIEQTPIFLKDILSLK
jgi:hypothetical protein